MQIKIKTSNENAFSLEVEGKSTVLELKTKIAEHFQKDGKELTTADQRYSGRLNCRLIFAGKVLKDEDSLETYKLQDGNTVHLVRGKKAVTPATSTPTATANPTSTTPSQPQLPPLGSFGAGPAMGAGLGAGFGAGFPGMGGMGAMGGMPGMGGQMPGMDQLVNNPMFAGMMSQMLSNPQMLDQIIAANPDLGRYLTPEVRARMQTPEFQAMISNPQMMQQMLQMQQMMGGMGGLPGMGGLTGMGGLPGAQPGTQPGANPFLNMPRPAAVPTTPPEELYATQLEQLREMGFYSPAENIRALQMSGGNVQAAVEILFSRPPGASF